MENFHHRLETRIKLQGQSLKSVSRAIGRPDGYISNLIAQENDPGGTVIAALAKVLNTTPNDLMGITGRFQVYNHYDAKDFIDQHALALVNAARDQARMQLCAIGGYPPIQEVYKWAANCNNVIDTTEDISRYFTTYKAPSEHDNVPTASFIGNDSLARNSLRTISTGELNSLIKKMPKEFVLGLMRDQTGLTEGKPYLSCERIPVYIPEARIDIDFNYARLYLRMNDRDGKPVILNYSEPLD